MSCILLLVIGTLLLATLAASPVMVLDTAKDVRAVKSKLIVRGAFAHDATLGPADQ
jgi:hypothetical protein